MLQLVKTSVTRFILADPNNALVIQLPAMNHIVVVVVVNVGVAVNVDNYMASHSRRKVGQQSILLGSDGAVLVVWFELVHS